MAGVLASTAAAVGIIDKAVGIAKKLADDSGELDKATLKLELANLMSELASVKMEVITTQALLFDAEQKNKQLEEQLKDKSTFLFRNGVWWKEGDEIAFCPKCYESDSVKFHMEMKERIVGMMASYDYKHWHCRRCNADFDRF
ncbi:MULTISPECIES: hypothetical protein [Citrobacter freundii complex]|uniref:hypothetical protein n=1 Tax=Citrobacter freundii complex TaxID=1344959 RepID=UPI0018AA1B95|nr:MULTISPECIES: hypothetical protein [Citrobacter freundii complex]MCR3706747.1 hypothetical protein [Citrobacter freundii]MDT7438183.1 hypothetical protein [Citrobacter freundii]